MKPIEGYILKKDVADFALTLLHLNRYHHDEDVYDRFNRLPSALVEPIEYSVWIKEPNTSICKCARSFVTIFTQNWIWSSYTQNLKRCNLIS